MFLARHDSRIPALMGDLAVLPQRLGLAGRRSRVRVRVHGKEELSYEDLLRSSRVGDGSALATLYSRHHDPSLRYARRLMANKADAEDVGQEAFLKVEAAIGRGNGPVTGTQELRPATGPTSWKAHASHATATDASPGRGRRRPKLVVSGRADLTRGAYSSSLVCPPLVRSENGHAGATAFSDDGILNAWLSTSRTCDDTASTNGCTSPGSVATCVASSRYYPRKLVTRLAGG